MAQFWKRFVSGHRFSGAANGKFLTALASELAGHGTAAKAEIDFVALTARIEAAPFQSKIKSEIFQQTVQPLGLARHGTAAKACVLYYSWRHA
jgi:hypothetical protein